MRIHPTLSPVSGHQMASNLRVYNMSIEMVRQVHALLTVIRRQDRHLVVVAQNLERASEDLQRLLDVLANQPSQLMFGERPAPRKVETETK